MIGNVFWSIIFLTTSIIVIFPKSSSSTWNFSLVDLPNDVPIWRFAFWRNRAFFAIPSFARREKRRVNNDSTLLEASWPEPGTNHGGSVSTIFDNDIRVFRKFSIERKECDKIASVVGLDIESSRGRLWILDSSENTDCSAKIVIYDLRRNDLEVVRTDLEGIPKNNLKTLVIDPHNGFSGPRAYIGDPGDESIIVYGLLKKRWWKLRLVRDPGIPSFSSTEMAISRKNSLLYLTDSRSQDLFSVDLETSRNDEGPRVVEENDMERNSTIKWLGKKMGRSSGLATDHKGGLHYFLVTEHASVRWDTKHDLKATSYSILLQSEKVPCVTDYRLDSHRNIWGLVNLENPLVKGSSSTFQGKWNGQFRTVRIFKHNPLAP